MLSCRILTLEEEVAALELAWRQLYESRGINPLSSYDSYSVWWEAIAREKGYTPHIVTGWRNERLVALIPLAVRQRVGCRILFVAGHDVFLGAMEMAEDIEDLKKLWQVVRQSHLYDAALIKYVQPSSPLQKILKKFPLSFCIGGNITSVVRFDGRTGLEWYQSTLSGDRRNKIKRKEKLIEKEGKTDFRLYTSAVPDEVVNATINLKRDWCFKSGVNSCVTQKDSFLRGLINKSADHGALRFFCLWCGEKPIGFCLTLAKGRNLLSHLIAHDPAFERASVGFLTNTLACRWAADNGFETFDFMEGREEFKATLANVRSNIETYVFCRYVRGLIGWAALIANSKKEALHRWLKDKRRR